MSISPADLHAIPLFEKITEEHLHDLMSAFERLSVAAGEVLFEAGTAPSHLLLLVAGEVALNEGDETRFRLSPIAPIGELGAVTGLRRATTAVATQPSVVWRISVTDLLDFWETHGDVAFPFYHNLLNIVTDKLRRDLRRLDEVRANLIRTQKGMKALLDQVLEAPETPVSRMVCSTLEDLIERNRRWHYMVEPARTLMSTVRLDDGATVLVREISDGWLHLSPLPAAPQKGAHWSGVLALPSREIPVSGTIDATGPDGTVIKLDLLIDEYAAALQDYLTRLQMLDFLV